MKQRGKKSDPVIEMLENASLWSGLDRKDLKFIVQLSKERKYETGDAIVRKGEGTVGFHLILDGSVEVRSGGTVLSKLGRGQFFGEMSVIDNQPRSADVVAMEPSRCLILSAWSFNALVSKHPKIALKILQEFVRRLRDANKALTE
jgi:CRP/FNR family transcriptional regulator/CRP/FNR family cyclic AMP-dependent transcriptional regulator